MSGNDPTPHPLQSVLTEDPGGDDLPNRHDLHICESVSPVSSDHVSAGHKPSQWSYVRQVNLRSTLSQVKSSVRVAVTLCPETEILYVLGKVDNDPAGNQFDLSMIEGHTNLVTVTAEGNVWGDIEVGVALTALVVAPGE